MNSLPCWPPSLLLLWGLEDMFNILLYSSSSPLIQPQPQVPAAPWLLMARDERRGIENPLIMTSTPLLLHCCCCVLVAAQAKCRRHACSLSVVLTFPAFTSKKVMLQQILCSTKYPLKLFSILCISAHLIKTFIIFRIRSYSLLCFWGCIYAVRAIFFFTHSSKVLFTNLNCLCDLSHTA